MTRLLKFSRKMCIGRAGRGNNLKGRARFRSRRRDIHGEHRGRRSGRTCGGCSTAGRVAGLTEAQLLDRVARRDEMAEAAFEAILTRHGPAVLACCRRVLGDPAAAEDAFQATFLVLFRRAGSIRVDDSLAPWLLHVARLAALKARQGETPPARRERRRRAAGGLTPEDDSSDLRLLVPHRGRSPAREVPRTGPPLLLRGSNPRRRGGGPWLAGRDGPRAAVAGTGDAPQAAGCGGASASPRRRWPRR